VRHITRVLVFGLLAAIVTLAASSENRQSATARVNAAGASSPVHEQPLPLPRLGLGAATGADGRVYTIGGNGPENERDPNNAHDLGVVEAYLPSRNTWACSSDDVSSGCATQNLAPLPTPRHGFVVVAGASNHGNSTLSLFNLDGTSAGSPLAGNGLNQPHGIAAVGSN
jgi:hypothetical protein